jgi:hypothetical protein
MWRVGIDFIFLRVIEAVLFRATSKLVQALELL